jgi:glycosyltransferase involved in cell wall biosynthesis
LEGYKTHKRFKKDFKIDRTDKLFYISIKMSNKFNPKVSIVIPVYNGSNYVKEAIDSALAQTYKNTEVIVINDGSNDKGKTDRICKSYGKRIRYFKKENGGVSSALNMGIDKMEGEYFSWLSHDDVYYPEKVEKQIEYLSKIENSSTVVLYANYELINERSKPTSKVELNHKELLEKPEYALLRGSVNGITLLIPKTAFKEYGNFNEELKCTQDYDMWNRIIKSYDFIHMNEIFTKTRIHSQQDSNKHPNVQKEGDKLWIRMIKDISSEKYQKLEGSEYNFYNEMGKFLKWTPYKGALEFVEKKKEEIYERAKGLSEETLVTVIIPFFNRIGLLERSIKSVLAQTYKNFELILINDGSTANIDKIKKLEQKDNRIKIIDLGSNKGVAYARNRGIDEAKGEFIAFLDSDDEFLPKKLETQVTYMQISKYDISHTSYICRNKENDKTILSGKLQGIVMPAIIVNCPIATPTVMTKTSFLLDNKFRFNESFHIGEDICFWLELLSENKLFGIEKAFTIVNIGRETASTNLEKQIIGLENILKFLFSNRKLQKYRREIAQLCGIFSQLVEEEGSIMRQEKLRFKTPLHKLFYLFKYQGVFLTIKKIIWKYGPKAINKVRRGLNGKR